MSADTSFARRLNILPGEGVRNLAPLLSEHLDWVVSNMEPHHFGGLLDPLMRQVLSSGFNEAGAHEGTVWLVDKYRQHLEVAYNTGPNAAQLVGQFKQPLSSGLISMVFASELPFMENQVWKNANQSKLLDSTLQVQTCAMIAVPFSFLQSCRGVLSCVRLRRVPSQEPEPTEFSPADLGQIQLTGLLLSRLLELRLINRAVGWGSE